MSERKRKRGRPRVAPVLSYGTELKLRNSIGRTIKKPKYLRDRDDDIDESRESTPARSIDTDDKSSISGKTKAYRGYNLEVDHDRESEYHYGSDFDGNDESDQERKTGFSTPKSSSLISDSDESDMDITYDYDQGDAVGGSSDFIPFWKLGPAGTLGHRTHTPLPVWLQDKEYPNLNLPKSSTDLLIPNYALFKTIGIYEILRHFQNLVRISPFRFEDFCAALLSDDQNILLIEIHIALLKSLIREEDFQQTHFGPLDLKDSINILLYLIDSMTWAEALRLYLHSDKDFLPYLEILNSCQYPFTNLENKLVILQFLCDQFLQTSPVRENLQNEGKVRYDDHCRVCHKTGDLLCCDSCSAVYHLDCIDPPLTQSPAELEDWTCNICKMHQVEGVTDCLSPMEASGLLCRQEPLGYDRHGRKYWFLTRRIIVESEDGEIWYYSSTEQFEHIQSIIDPVELEEGLHIAFREFGDDIRKQMKMTEKLTNKARGHRKSVLMVDNDKLSEKKENLKKEIKSEDESDEIKNEIQDSGVITINEMANNNHQNKESLEIKKEKREILDDEEKQNLLSEKKSMMSAGGKRPPKNDDHLYCLGCDNTYKNYVNIYVTNTLALNKIQHNEERDKRRHLSHKFSLGPPFEFKWNGQTHGSMDNMITTVRQTLLSLESNISTYFFHPHWPQIRKTWQQAAIASNNSCHFAKLFRWLTVCVKSCVFHSVWNESLGHIQLKRITALERDDKKKQEKREKKESDEESRYYPFIKYTRGVKHQLWKMKGEEYRIHGLWGWAWVTHERRVSHIPINTVGLRAGPEKITIPIKSSPSTSTGSSPSIRGLPINPSAFKQLSAKSPSLKFSILSPNQLKAEQTGPALTQYKKNEIIITNAGIQQKVEVIPINLEDYFEDGIINISKNLSSKNRLVYPRLGKISALDSLLSRRVALQLREEKEISSKKLFGAENVVEEKSVESIPTDIKLGDKIEGERAENVEELPDSQRLTVHKDRPAGHLLKEMRTYKLKYEALDKLDDGVTCYSKSCREDGRIGCYSPSCMLREKIKQKFLNSVNIYKIVTSKPAPFRQVGVNFPIKFEEPNKSEKSDNKQKDDESLGEQMMDVDESSQSSCSSSVGLKHNRIYSSEDTKKPVFLKKLMSPRKNMKSLRLPQMTNFKRKSKIGKIDGGYSVMVLAQWELKMLARKAGRMNVSGFTHTAKMNNAAWPYPCSRPAFKTMWLYRTSTIKSISAAALQLRILWADFRWDDMSEKGPADGRKQITTDTEIIQTEILKRKYYGKFLEKTEYLQRKVIIPLDVPRPVREFTPSQRSGLRKRRRAQSPVSKQPQSLEVWIEEDRLNLWEVRFFGERLEKSSLLSKKPVQYDKNDSITSSISSSPLEFKAKIEEQLKLQRANFNQKKSLESSLPSSGIVKLTIGNSTSNMANKVTFSGKTVTSNSTIVNLPSIIGGKKIVTTKGGKIITVQAPSSAVGQGDKTAKLTVGNASVFPVSSLPKVQVTQQGNKVLRFQTLSGGRQRTILPRGTSPTNIVMPRVSTPTTTVTTTNNQSSTAPTGTTVRPAGQQIQIFRMPDGQLQVRGLQDGQQVLQRADGKLQLINTKPASGTSTISVPQVNKSIPTDNACSPTKTPAAPATQIVKINGQQIILRTNQPPKQIVTLGNKNTNVADTIKSLPLKTTKVTDSPTKIVADQKTNDQLINNTVTPAQNTNSITLRVQVRMTEQGPKTIIQGLQPGIVLTKDHIMAIQQQVRTMLAQYNLQVNQLSPLMTLTLHLPKGSIQSGQVVAKTSPTGQNSPLKIARVEKKETGNTLLNEDGIKVSSIKSVDANKIIKKDEKSSTQGDKFILTNDYIQQSIKSALKRSDLSPDVEEKLMQMQKYTNEQNDNEELKAEDEALLKSLKRVSEDEDDDWLNDQLGIKPKKLKLDKPARPKKEPQLSSKTLVQDAKKKIAKQQKLDGFLAKHKELLKKDILKKRALLEKELQLRIHKELTAARLEMDKIKSPDLNMPVSRKRTSVDTIAKTPPVPLRKEPVSNPVLPPKQKQNPTIKSKKVIKSKSKKIVCICRTPFDDTKFYVGCDLCGNWFHGDCVGITEALSRTMTEYVCDDCANAKLNKELFCICRQPYDESQFYICCEKCEDWYHGKCIGIMQVEADDIDDYICPKCEPNNEWNQACQKKLTSKDYIEVKKVAKSLVQHKSAWPFLEPVDQSEVPDYYKVVKAPMDLRTVENKVNNHQYLNLAQFVGNVMLVFDNCRAYNPPNSSFCTCAIALESFFCSRLKQLKLRLMQKS